MSTLPKSLLLIAVALATLAGLYGGFIGSQRPAPAAMPGPPLSPPGGAATNEPIDAAETRRLAMQVTYADLEKDRLLLNRQLGALNASLWGLRLPAARAQSIQNDMMAAKSLLTNPPLLGAFADAAAIQHERDRVNSALARLQAVEGEVRARPGGQY